MARTVTVKISPELMRQILRLDSDTKIVGAGVLWEYGHGCLTFTVRDPNAPVDAVEMEPVFKRHLGPDPIHLQSIRWLRADGTEVPTEPFPLPVEDAA